MVSLGVFKWIILKNLYMNNVEFCEINPEAVSNFLQIEAPY